MLSRQVTRLEEDSQALESFLNTHGGTVGAGIAVRAAALGLEVEPPPDTALQLLLTEALRQGRQQLSGADREHSAEKEGDGPKRDERDAAVAQLYTRLQQVRGLLVSLYGPKDAAAMLGFSGTLGRHPPTLKRQAEMVMEQFSSSPPTPPSLEAGVELPGPEAIPEMLRVPLQQLQVALLNLHEERRRAEATLAQKDALLEDQYLLVRSTVGMLYSLSRLAGRPDLGERVRALVRRPRRGDSLPEVPGPTPGDPGGPPGPVPGGELPGPGVPIPEEPFPGLPVPIPPRPATEPARANGKGGAHG